MLPRCSQGAPEELLEHLGGTSWVALKNSWALLFSITHLTHSWFTSLLSKVCLWLKISLWESVKTLLGCSQVFLAPLGCPLWCPWEIFVPLGCSLWHPWEIFVPPGCTWSTLQRLQQLSFLGEKGLKIQTGYPGLYLIIFCTSNVFLDQLA